MVEVTDYRNTDMTWFWPDEPEWILDETYVDRGTPRFLVLRNREVVLNAKGSRSWQRGCYPHSSSASR